MPSFKPLGEEESLFSNIDSLDLEFVPKFLPHREAEQTEIAGAIRPLLEGVNGKNLLVLGAPGIGKTHAVKRVLDDLEAETDEVKWAYVNCWNGLSSKEVLVKVSEALGFRYMQGLSSPQLVEKIKNLAETKKGLVFAFDEIDKAGDYDFLYALLEGINKKAVIMISNEKEWLGGLDERIRSRLLPERIEFSRYSEEETLGILKERKKYAFFEGTWSQEALELVAGKAFGAGDIRVGVKLLREAGLAAENEAKRLVEKSHAEKAINKLSST